LGIEIRLKEERVMFKKFLHPDLSYPRPEIFPGPPPAADYSILLLAVPAFSTLFLWVWGYMHLSQNTGMELSIIAVSMIATTASIAAREASKVGMRANKEQGTHGPTAWFFIILLFWILGYPLYLYKRHLYGLTNYLVIGTEISVIFTVNLLFIALSMQG
jgi:hypothetical protein